MRKKLLFIFLMLAFFLIPLKVISKNFENLQKVKSSKILSVYTTKFDKNYTDRVHNIKLASRSINNVVIYPSTTFSFNTIVGDANFENGYKKTKVVLYDELIDGVGGGVCQVSSTLYNAVDNCGLEIIELHNHTKDISYVPTGRDATIAYGVKDFIFKNNTEKTIIIKSSVKDNKLEVKIYST